MKKRIFAGIMTLFMIFTLLSPVEAKAAENYDVSITLPEGAEVIELTDEVPVVYLEGATLAISDYEGEITQALVYYENEEYEVSGIWFHPTEDGTLMGYLDINVDMEGTYTLSSIIIWNEDGEEEYIVLGLPDSSYTVVNNITDKEPPVITDVQIEGYGETFVQGQGQTVTITANVLDEGLGVDEDSVSVVILSAKGEYVNVQMQKQADDTYAATISIDSYSLYNTDWRVSDLAAVDMVGNYGDYYSELQEMDLYFCVADEDGYCDMSRDDITLSFYDEDYNFIDEFYVSSSGRTATLAELLDEVPEYETEFGFEGWRIDGTDIVLKNDTAFLIPESGYWFDFYPETSVKQVKVDIWCLDENGELNWTGYETYTIQKGTTYAELLEMLPTPETVNGCNFLGWKFSASDIELSEEVDMQYIDIEAIYDKIIVSVGMDYITAEGVPGYEYKTLAVEEGTTYGELLELLEAPEAVEGCDFTGWTYYALEGSLDDTVESEAWLTLAAEYDHYPVAIMNVYIGADGEVVFENLTEVYPAGTLMQDIRDEWIAKLDELAEGVAEWYVVTIEEEISIWNYNLVLYAQYEDQVVVTFEPEYLKDAGEYGIARIEDYFAVLDKEECTEENLIACFEEEIIYELSLYDDVVLVRWNYACEDLNEDGYLDLVTAYPDYEYNTPVVMAFGDGVMIYAVEAGQTISLPTEIAGYYVTWEDVEGNSYTGSYTVPSDFVVGDGMLLTAITGDPVVDEDDPSVNPEDPDQPDNPVGPENPEDPADPENPADPEDPADPEGSAEADKPADTQKPGQSSASGTTAPETSDGTNSVPYMVVLLMGAAFIMLAMKKRQNI